MVFIVWGEFVIVDLMIGGRFDRPRAVARGCSDAASSPTFFDASPPPLFLEPALFDHDQIRYLSFHFSIHRDRPNW
jgi:hypothetical protein